MFSFTVFDGFRQPNPTPVQLATTIDQNLGGSIALECDFRDSKPRPTVQWFMNNVSMIAEDQDQNRILYLEGGRYLFIRELTMAQRNAFYHCEVSFDPFLTRQRAPTTYTLDRVLPLNDLVVYRPVPLTVAVLNEPVTVVYAAASRRGTETFSEPSLLSLSCINLPTGITVQIANSVVATFTGITGVASNRRVSILCLVQGTLISPASDANVTFNFEVARKY